MTRTTGIHLLKQLKWFLPATLLVCGANSFARAESMADVGELLTQALEKHHAAKVVVVVRCDVKTAKGGESALDSIGLTDEVLAACKSAGSETIEPIRKYKSLTTLTVTAAPRPADLRKVLKDEEADLLVTAVWQTNNKTTHEIRLTLLNDQKVLWSWRGKISDDTTPPAAAKDRSSNDRKSPLDDRSQPSTRNRPDNDEKDARGAGTARAGSTTRAKTAPLVAAKPDTSTINGKVLKFALDHIGRRYVGDGTSFDLVDTALKSAGAKPRIGGVCGQEVEMSDVRPGDILTESSTANRSWHDFRIVAAVSDTQILLVTQCSEVRAPVHATSYSIDAYFQILRESAESVVAYRPQAADE